MEKFINIAQITDEQAIWKTHPDYPVLQANQFGEVRTKDRWVPCNGGKRFIKGRVLRQQLDKYGYLRVCFGMNGKAVYLQVHRIVATCFLPNPNNLPQVNHKDCNRTNNYISNLEWCTQEYNNTYCEKYGIACNRSVIAVKPKTSEAFRFESQHEAARQFSVGAGNVSKVANGKINKTGGCWSCYADKTVVEKTREKFGNEVAKEVEKLMNEIT